MGGLLLWGAEEAYLGELEVGVWVGVLLVVGPEVNQEEGPEEGRVVDQEEVQEAAGEASDP